MVRTVYGDFKAIEKPINVGEDEGFKAYQNAIAYWSKKIPLIDEKIKDKISLTTEFDNLAKLVGGLRALLPHLVGKEERDKIRQIEEIVAEPSEYEGNFFPVHFGSRLDTLVLNPVTTAIIGGTAYKLVNYIIGREAIIEDMAYGALIGGLLGLILYLQKLYTINYSRQRLQSIESKIIESKIDGIR